MKNLIILFITSFSVFGQSVFVPLNTDCNHFIDRYEIKYGQFAPNINTTFKSILRKDIAFFADSLEKSDIIFSNVDKFNLQYLKSDNLEFFNDSLAIGKSKKSVLKHLYKYQNSIFRVSEKYFELQINPVFNFEQRLDNKDYIVSLNTRGIELRGSIGKKIGFYSFLADNQAFVPGYVQQVNDSIGATPANGFVGENFTKPFKKNGYDFFNSRGYITFNLIKQMHVQFGHDKNFIGNGYRSIFLSDFSGKYMFLKFTTQVWKFNYTNLFAELTGDVVNANTINPRKYVAMHHLSINIRKNLQIGLFESIIFNRDSSGNPGFELNYLNPVIFYREVESYLGSKDKTSVGLDLKWNFTNHFSLYGQFSLHEFKLREIAKSSGWWANKYAWQLGLKYIDAFGFKNLDFQVEHNYVRPFVYADKSAATAYTNYNQALAHPMGANFYEFLGIVRYQPLKRLSFTAKLFYIVYGKDFNGQNFGGDIRKSYTTRTKEYQNVVGQGVQTKTFFVSFNASFMLKHNLFIDLRQTFRSENSVGFEALNNSFTTFGMRFNIAQRLQEF